MYCRGTLQSSGEVFDSSHRKGRPFQFTIGIGQVIRGWDEGVMTMSLGEEATLHLTSDVAYGSRGIGPIPPNADLDFEVKVLAINGVQAAVT
jgi:FK506-binding protein 1